jgi:polar amino acid transport system substrate-binding protein
MVHKFFLDCSLFLQRAAGCLKILVAILPCAVFSANPAQAAEIRLLTGIEPPTNYLDERGELTGIAVDIIEELKRSLGVHAQIEVYPWARALKLAETNPGVVLFTGTKTIEREAMGFHFIGPFVTRRHMVYSRADDPTKLKNLKDIAAKKARVVGMRGDWRTQLFKRRGAAIEETPQHIDSVRMLLAGRADFWLSSDLELPLMLKSAGAAPDAVDEAVLIREASSYLLVSRGTDPALLEAWQAAFAQLQTTGFFEQLARKWSRKLGVNYAYSKAKGMHLKEVRDVEYFSYSLCAHCGTRFR